MVQIVLIPTAEQISELRKLFFEKLDKEGAPATCAGGFHPNDIDRVEKVDIWLQRFLEQNDLDMKASLKQLWETCEWRQTFGTNDITESSINMDYVNVGDCFPRNHDIEGKMMLIYRSVLHVKGKRDAKELIRIFVYWIERMYRNNNFDPITIFFDLADCGLKNLDMDYTINVVNILKSYYPNAVNYILIYEMPWVFAAGIKIIKSLLPPKAVSTMKFIDSKNIGEYISSECMMRSWGGLDDYTFHFEPEALSKQRALDVSV
ncbi:hypothetical protein HA402_001480 [Bradysia odoriphaga]|nr:hypothetical protein HA402_001480 [Bradysia odoriphaga]